MINRLILWLSLAGMVLAVHLWVQKARGFDQGCLGLLKPAAAAVAAERGGCEEVGALPASHLFGVSNAAWGYGFYFALALVSFAKIFAAPHWARRLHAAGEIAVWAALLYSGYLVYTMAFVARAWCVLCTVSAVLVALLAGLHVMLRRRGGFQPVVESARLTELAAAGGGFFAAMGVLVGLLVFVARLGTRPLDQGSTRAEIEDVVGGALPKFIDPAKLREMRACRFEDERVLPWREFVSEKTPFVGRADGPTVVVFYDPNCGHCAAYHPTLLRAMERFKDRARFTIRPRVLWDASILQVAALQLAEDSGKYFELWQAMFDRPKDGSGKGASVEEIATMFRRLGLDATNLAARLEAVRPQVLAARDRAKRAEVGGVPAIFIDGRRVWSLNRGEDCLGKLIEKSAQK